MKQKNSDNVNVTLRLAGVILLAVLWIGLVGYIFVASGFNLKNILMAAFSGIIIFYPLWNKYLKPIFDKR